MMKKLALVFLLLICPLMARAADLPTASLFYTDDETRKVEKLLGQTPYRYAMEGDVHLGAILYYAPDDWVLWLQGERWTPATNRDDLHVLEVEPGAVRLRLNSVPDVITLKPDQTYQLATGAVVEGSSSSGLAR